MPSGVYEHKKIFGKFNSNWKNGRYEDKRGYSFIRKPGHPRARVGGCYVLEHILVMEEHLKRPIQIGEAIHHLNGIPSDNRIENLMLFPNNVEHIKFHSKTENWKTKFKIDKDWLKKEYIDKNRTQQNIAKEVGCNDATLKNRLRKFGIRKRGLYKFIEYLRR
jgi:hypothetical protein